MLRFKRCRYLGSNPPKEDKPHLLVAGRSNVGKSSLLNYIFRAPLMPVSSTPGKTDSLHFFEVDSLIYMVDSPGYGYAKSSKASILSWNRSFSDYLMSVSNLQLLHLLDIRRNLTPNDYIFLEYADSIGKDPFFLFTKSDKLPKSKLTKRVNDLLHSIGRDIHYLVASLRYESFRLPLIKSLWEWYEDR